MNQIVGNCSKCGAPYSMPSVWHGITPPPAQPTCNCWNTNQIHTSGTSDSMVVKFNRIENLCDEMCDRNNG